MSHCHLPSLVAMPANLLALALAGLLGVQPAWAQPADGSEEASQPVPVSEVPEPLSDRLLELESLIDRHDVLIEQEHGLLRGVERALPVTIGGSVATRYQHVGDFQGPALVSRPETRLRLSLQLREAGPVSWQFRLVTGAPDAPFQSWVPVASFWGKTPIALDRYFLRWQPWEPLALTVGKFPDPFANSELLWDNDIQPQGLLQTLDLGSWLPEGMDGGIQLGQLVMHASGSDVSANSYALGGRAALSGTITPWLKLDGALGYYDFLNADALVATPAFRARPSRNRLRADGLGLLHDMNLLNGFGRVTVAAVPGWPLRLTADYLQNLAAPDQNKGLRLGAFVGSVRSPGDWMAVYRYKRVEADAALSALAEDLVVGTDIQAHEVGVTGRVLKDSFVEGTVQVMSRLSVSTAPLWTLRLSWLQRF